MNFYSDERIDEERFWLWYDSTPEEPEEPEEPEPEPGTGGDER